MTCRCRTKEEHAARALEQEQASRRYAEQHQVQQLQELRERTPNPDAFTIEDIEQVGEHLVIKVRYPGCTRCDFDRCKVMVYFEATLKQAVTWRRIDPHFKAPNARQAREAPPPAARFPATSEGWNDAIAYARSKKGPQ